MIIIKKEQKIMSDENALAFRNSLIATGALTPSTDEQLQAYERPTMSKTAIAALKTKLIKAGVLTLGNGKYVKRAVIYGKSDN